VIDNPREKLSALEVVSKEEKEKILYTFNNTDAFYPKDKAIHRWFAEQAQRIPDRTALIGQIPNKIHLTYKELNEKSAGLARLLRGKGVGVDIIVGIMVERSIEMIVGILGILKAGGAYLPIDPDYPQERKQYMLADSNANILLTSHEISILSAPEAFNNRPKGTSSLAYIIYTSGTTGKPKGVMINHENVVRLLFNDKFPFDFCDRDVWTMFHSFCFDFSVWEMYGALLYGGVLIMIPKAVARDPAAYREILEKENVTILNQTPSAFYNLIHEELKHPGNRLDLKYVIFGGEALKPGKVKEWKTRYPGTKLINMYGITETTVHVTYKEIGQREIAGNISAIGGPIPTLHVYIMDKHLHVLPIGVPGELCIGGAGVARGYLNRTELTARRFVTNPYPPGEVLYRSGDLARRLEDGEMEYLGRMDHQVKIRGFRVESGEIENQLLKHEGIKECVVIGSEDQTDQQYLCAYIVPYSSSPDSSTLSGLREYLREKLPDYMIPSYFIPLQRIPLTANGKIDRKNLPGPGGVTVEAGEYWPPRNEMEMKLTEIWERVLGVRKIGISSGFFNIGGDSIKAIRLISAMNARLNTNLSLVDLYANETIEEIAGMVRQKQGDRIYTTRQIKKITRVIQSLKQQIIARNKLPVDIEDLYPMSDIEKGMVFYYLKNSDIAVYHDQFVYPMKFKGFEGELFEKALSLLVEKHEILRTGFDMEDFAEPIQMVHKSDSVSFNPDYHDISHMQMQPGRQEEFVKEFLRKDRENRFNTAIPPLFRMGVFRLDDENIWAALIFHHAILDGWSAASLMTELHNTYLKLKVNPGFVPGKLKSSYKDVVIEEMIEKEKKEPREYWLNELKNYKRMELPGTFHKDDRSQTMKVYEYDMGEEFLVELRKTANKFHTSLKHLCFGAYVYMLGMFSSYEDEPVVGIVSNNRPIVEDGDKLLGCFLNTVPVKMVIPREGTWREYITRVENKLKELKTYERLSLFEIARLINETGKDRNPIFDTLFNFMDFHIYQQAEAGENVHRHYAVNRLSIEGNQNTNTLFDFEVDTTFERFLLCPKYYPTAMSDEMVQRACIYFERILNTFIHEPRKEINRDDIIPGEEKRRLLREFNDTRSDYSRDRTLHELLEDQVGKTPHHPAVGCAGNLLTYQGLNRRANQWARALRKKGVSRGDLIGIVMDRSIEMIVGVLAIVKAGGAYVPLEPDLPGARLSKILGSLEIESLITNDLQMQKAGEISAGLSRLQHIFCLDGQGYGGGAHVPGDRLKEKDLVLPGDIALNPGENLNAAVDAADTAYVIFTSGSTGNPKGVVVKHRSVINIIEWVNKTFNIEEGDKLLFISSLSFDLSVYDIFGILASGAGVQVVAKDDIREPRRLLDIIIEEGITFWDSAPAALQQLVPFFPEVKDCAKKSKLRLVFLSGDWIPVSMPDALRDTFVGVRVISLGGATEATIWSNYYPIHEVDPSWVSIPYGKPIQNAAYYILTPGLKICPIGVPGDLYIGGECLASEYINDAELTAHKFIDNPFAPGEIIYKTGDIARWFEDGNMEFLGRKDFQVKIRGYRVEPGEIENQILNYEGIKEAIVLAWGDQTNKYLCAYVVIEAPLTSTVNPFDFSPLQQYLSRQLPGYMIPAHFIRINRIPLTSNGKVNRKALPEPEGSETAQKYISPADQQEERLIGLWSEILQLQKDKISVCGDFFELGGHSLNATVLAAKIYKTFGIKMPLAEIFSRPTVKQMSQYIKKTVTRTHVPYVPLEPVEKKDYYPLSSTQKRVYILQQMESGSMTYNMPTMVTIEGRLHRQRLEEIFMQLIRRHESLRTSFRLMEAEPVHTVHNVDELDFEIEYYDLQVTGAGDRWQEGSWLNSFIRPFDLSQAPLLRVRLVHPPLASGPLLSKGGHSLLEENPGTRYILMVDMHHIISDAISIGVLIDEFMALYERKTLSDLRIRYRDFSTWQNSKEERETIKKQEKYWLKQFEGEIPVLMLPFDYERPRIQSFAGSTRHFVMAIKETGALKKIAHQQGMTLFMVLLAIYNVFLARISGQEDIVVGTSTAGRRHPDLEQTIGMFVNTLAFRNYPREEKTFRQFLYEVKENTLQAFENQDYPFDELVERVSKDREANRNPLFDVRFKMDNFELSTVEVAGLKLTPYTYENKTSKFDMTLTALESDDTLDFEFEYCTKLFKEETIERFFNYIRQIAAEVMGNRDIKIEDIEVSHDLLSVKPDIGQVDLEF